MTKYAKLFLINMIVPNVFITGGVIKCLPTYHVLLHPQKGGRRQQEEVINTGKQGAINVFNLKFQFSIVSSLSFVCFVRKKASGKTVRKKHK